MRPSVFSFSLADLRDYFVSQGLAKYAADQVYNWVYRKYDFDFESWSNVSAKVKAHIKNGMDITLPKIVWKGLSEDGTRKYLIQMNDKQTVEAVVIPAKNNRLTQHPVA